MRVTFFESVATARGEHFSAGLTYEVNEITLDSIGGWVKFGDPIPDLEQLRLEQQQYEDSRRRIESEERAERLRSDRARRAKEAREAAESKHKNRIEREKAEAVNAENSDQRPNSPELQPRRKRRAKPDGG